MKGIVVLGGPSVLVLGDSVSEPDMYLAALWPGQGGLRWSVSLSPWTQLNINVRSSHEAPVTCPGPAREYSQLCGTQQ